PAVLALGFAASAVGLLLRGQGRSTAVAAGLFLSAGLLAQPLLTAALLAVTLAAPRAWPRPVPSRTGERLAIAAGVAALGAVPAWVRAPLAVSATEWSSRLEAGTAASLAASIAALVALAVVVVAVDRLLARGGPVRRPLLCALGLAACGVTAWEWQPRPAPSAWGPRGVEAPPALPPPPGPLAPTRRAPLP